MNIVVYCSSRQDLDADYQRMAQAVGQWIGSNRHTLVYGGVNAGLMHIVAQATANAGGNIIGVVPQTFAHRTDPLCNQVIACLNLSDRKDIMIEQGDAFICLPGGIGTIDEWISTLSQLIVAGIENKKPIFAVNYKGMYDNLIAQLGQCAHSPFARGKNIDCTIIAKETDSLINLLKEYII
ncbi:MAG: TIGR00730 family Rossman fold protein [Muribaculaceae bacterium]